MSERDGAAAARPGIEVPVAVRWGDMDSYGHVNNVFFVRYLEDTRFAVFTPPLADRAAAGVPPALGVFDLYPAGSKGLVASHHVEYVNSLNWRQEPISSRLWITRIGSSSFSIAYELAEPDHSTVYAIAATTLVLVDDDSGRPVAVPDDLRATLTQWLGDAPAFRA